jgi:(5-formylfuran-3-yl)methyl phosphate transaminase
MSPFMVMEILEKAQAMEAAGRHVVHMEIGEPDFTTPESVKQAAGRCLLENGTKYTHSLGLAELRAAIADSYRRNYGTSIDPERVIVTTGTSGGMLLAFAALIDPGDEVVVGDPGYPCYHNFIRLVDGQTVLYRLREEDGWQLSADALRPQISPLTKAIVVNSPTNPTGTVLTAGSLSTAADLCPPGAVVISDEIYHGMVYEGRARSILEFTDRAVVVNGFSKLYAMTGWRLGYLIVPPELIRPIQKLQQNLFIAPPSISQWAAVAALTSAAADVSRMVKTYDERRRWLLAELKRLGFGIPVEPTGAFYILADARHLSDNSYDLAIELLEQAGVALTPGSEFGEAAEGYLRFSYGNSLDQIKEGCRRIEAWLEGRK